MRYCCCCLDINAVLHFTIPYSNPLLQFLNTLCALLWCVAFVVNLIRYKTGRNNHPVLITKEEWKWAHLFYPIRKAFSSLCVHGLFSLAAAPFPLSTWPKTFPLQITLLNLFTVCISCVYLGKIMEIIFSKKITEIDFAYSVDDPDWFSLPVFSGIWGSFQHL